MSIGPYAIEGVFAIVAGGLTIAKGKAWIGPSFPATFVLSGPITFVIGGLAIVLGLFILVTV